MILAILQARVSSTRLPGKVLKPILGMPMLLRQIERLKRASRIDRLLVATSTEASDNAVQELMEMEGTVGCFRGHLEDVLDRFYSAAKIFSPQHVVRLTGDCPLADPEVIDKVIAFHLERGYDCSSNTLEPTFPDGLDVEVFRFKCLERAWREARLPSQREHVTPYIYQHPEKYKIGYYKNPVNLSYMRWTVDEPEDFDLVNRIYEALYPANPGFTTGDILSYLENNPGLGKINAGHKRNEGFEKSLRKDRAYLQGQ
ncbi:MAG: cytidylyltransferase domain-containing protein [Bacillota bacterium]